MKFTSWISNGLAISGIFAILGAIGLAKTTSETLQVGTYSIARSVADGFNSAIPSFLVPKTGIDIQIPLLTSGSVANAIVAETLKVRQMEEDVKPLKSVISTLETNLKVLAAEQTQLESAASLIWVGLQKSTWILRYRVSLEEGLYDARMKAEEKYYKRWFIPLSHYVQSWIATNASAAHTLEKNLTNIDVGLIPDIIWAYTIQHEAQKDRLYRLNEEILEIQRNLEEKRERGEMGLNISLDSGGIAIKMRPEDFQAEFKQIDETLATAGAFLPIELQKYIGTQLKLYKSIGPRVEAITAGLSIERGRAAFDVLMKHIKGQDLKHQKVLESVKTLVKQCIFDAKSARQCINVGPIDAGMDGLLGELRGRGFDFPENILDIIYTAELQGSKQALTVRGLQRLLDIEDFRKNPNMYTTLLITSLFLGFTCFLMAIAYAMASIVMIGILGTFNNLLGTIYTWTEMTLETSRHKREHVKKMLLIQNTLAELTALQELQGATVTAQEKGVPTNIIRGLLRDSPANRTIEDGLNTS